MDLDSPIVTGLPCERPGSNPECDGGYAPEITSNESEALLWFFPSARLTPWPEI